MLHVDAGGEKFTSALQQEAIFGGINLMLALLLVSISVVKPVWNRGKQQTA